LHDPFLNSVDIFIDIRIPEMRRPETIRQQIPIPFPTISRLREMHVPIDLDYQHCGMAIEIYDVVVNDLLSAEVQAFQPPCPQLFPEFCLCRRHLPAEFPGAFHHFA
jgi:hypothetical protein